MSEQSLNPLVVRLQAFIDIARMRRGPEDLPFDRSLLVMAVAAYGLLNLVFALILPRDSGEPPALALADIPVTLVSLQVLLRLARRPERFVQTAAAMFGFPVVLAPALLISAWLLLRYGEDSTWQLPVLVLRFAVEIWVLAVAARILRAATEWPLLACVGLMIAQQLLTYSIVTLIYPQALGASAPA